MALCFPHLLSFFICASVFLFALRMIMLKYYFCKKSVNSFLGFSNAMDSPPPAVSKCGLGTLVLGLSNAMDSPPPAVSKCGLGTLVSHETPRVGNPNIIESSMMAATALPSKKKDPGGIGFKDDMGGGVDGLMSCTESLGFESCDERRVDDDDDNYNYNESNYDDHRHHMELSEGEREGWRRKRSEEKRSERSNNNKFPPPLSSLNQNGQPCFYLKPVRKNGRLELTEVRIQRSEVLHAVRENGRLRLHLVSSDVSYKINEEQEQEETEQEEQEQELHLQEEEEEFEELWKFRVSGEGFRRCNELVMSHHHHRHINDHHSLHVWRQPCVTTR
ncbi:protein FANTASTIC FOUR 3-like [Durio zibethinus]|uniref:Protein FANTASTIC FOUR 3-like n=1 Tax=Durio zibethinus TaxID=66656 RepID=A0A6P5WVB9_DURZI|nr:protein FANTASTIC FOUR 3-like [Durio zibethinus]